MRAFLTGFFREDNGNPSMSRLVTFLVVGVILFHWIYAILLSQGKAGIDAYEITLLGIAMGNKIVSKLTERG